MLLILFYLFIGIVSFHFLYFMLLYSSIAFKKLSKTKQKNSSIPVSVIVYVKDNEEELASFLTTLIEQNYTAFEIVLVNNASEDNSLSILEAYAAAYPFIRLVNVENNEAFWGNKKYALTLGIKVARFDYLLFLEPNASPNSKMWLASMFGQFTFKKNIVIGHTTIQKIKGKLSNKYARYLFFLESLNNFSWTEFHKPIHGNNYNQGYTKELFFKANGFIKQMKIDRGEEQEFIRQISTSSNTVTIYTADSTTILDEKYSWKTNFNKQNEINLLIKRLGFFTQLKLRIYNFSTLLFYLVCTVLLVNLYNWEVVVALLVVRYLITFIYYNKLFKKFNEKDLLFAYPIIEFIQIIASNYISIKQFISFRKS